MRISTRFTILVDSFRKRVKQGIKSGIHQTCALIRLEARQSIRVSKRASAPGRPPHSRTRGGLREINFHVEGDTGIIGPRKFRQRNRLNRPVPNVHEMGGIAFEQRRGSRRIIKRYPERSFMYRAVKTLKNKGKLNSKFRYMLRSY
jgi:hypothetical protein